MFPCKPETVTRTIPIAREPRAVAMRSCDADGVTFAVAHTTVGDSTQAPAVLAGWRASTLAGLRADPALVSSDPPTGLPLLPQALVLRANRSATEPPAPRLLGVWFAKGSDVFAAFVVAPSIPVDVVEPFFAGLRLR